MLSPQELSSSGRQGFIPKLLDWLDDTDPAVLLNWDTSDQFTSDGVKLVDIKTVLYRELIERMNKSLWYDFIIEYDPAKNTAFFGDESWGVPLDDRVMQEEFKKLDIKVTDGWDNNLIQLLLDKDAVKSSGSWMDKVFLQMIEKAIKDQWKKLCIIIDKANLFIHQEWVESASREKINNESILIDLIRFLRENEWNHLILIDRKDCLNWDLKQEIPFIEIPATTRADIESLLKWVIDIEKHPEVFHFTKWIKIRTAKRIITQFRDYKDSDKEEKIISAFKEEKIKEMNSELKWTAELFEVTFTRDQIEMPEVIMEEIDSIVSELTSWSEFIHQWMILPWPPWTWKTAIAQYIASMCNMPFFKLADIWSETWRWNTEKKMRILKSVLVRNKPCILFVDEISDIWWKSSWEIKWWWDKDDAEVNRLIKEMLWSPEMKWVFIVWACNDLDKLDPAIYRSQRLEQIIPILPPISIKARKKTFKAVWNQYESLKWKLPDDNFIDFVCSKWKFIEVIDEQWRNYWNYSEITWADYYSMISEAWRKSNANKQSIEENILFVLNNRSFKKDNDFEKRIISALILWNRLDLIDDQKWEQRDNPAITEVTAMLVMRQDLELKLEQFKDLKSTQAELEGSIKALTEEAEKLNWEISGINSMITSRTREERTKLAQKLREARRRLKAIQTVQAQALQVRAIELDNRDWELHARESELDKRNKWLLELQRQISEQSANVERLLRDRRTQISGDKSYLTPSIKPLNMGVIPDDIFQKHYSYLKWWRETLKKVMDWENIEYQYCTWWWTTLSTSGDIYDKCWFHPGDVINNNWKIWIFLWVQGHINEVNFHFKWDYGMEWQNPIENLKKSWFELIFSLRQYLAEQANNIQLKSYGITTEIFDEHYYNLFWWEEVLEKMMNQETLEYRFISWNNAMLSTSVQACSKYWFFPWDIVQKWETKWIIIWEIIEWINWLWCLAIHDDDAGGITFLEDISKENQGWFELVFSPRQYFMKAQKEIISIEQVITDEIYDRFYSRFNWWRNKLNQILWWKEIYYMYYWNTILVADISTSIKNYEKYWFYPWDVIELDTSDQKRSECVVIWEITKWQSWKWNLAILFKWYNGIMSINPDGDDTFFDKAWKSFWLKPRNNPKEFLQTLWAKLIYSPRQEFDRIQKTQAQNNTANRHFNINVQNLSPRAREHEHRLVSWLIEKAPWLADRIVSITRFNDLLDQVSGHTRHIPVAHIEELLLRHNPEHLWEFARDCIKIWQNCIDNEMPWVYLFPQVIINGQSQEDFTMELWYDLINWANIDWRTIQKMWYSTQWVPSNLLTKQPDWIMRAYSHTCLKWSKGMWYSQEMFRKIWLWEKTPKDFQVALQERLLWKWFEIDEWMWMAWNTRALETSLSWNMERLLISDWMRLNRNDTDSHPLSVHSDSDSFNLNWSHGKPNSDVGVGASRGFPWIVTIF